MNEIPSLCDPHPGYETSCTKGPNISSYPFTLKMEIKPISKILLFNLKTRTVDRVQINSLKYFLVFVETVSIYILVSQ